MKGYPTQNKYKSSSQIMYSPPLSSFGYTTQNNFTAKPTRPKGVNQMNDRQLLKQQFYLSRFIRTLQANSTMPTLPNQSLLVAIKRQNELMQEKVEAYRNGTYEQYLIKKLNTLARQIQTVKTSSRIQTFKTSQNPVYSKQPTY